MTSLQGFLIGLAAGAGGAGVILAERLAAGRLPWEIQAAQRSLAR